MTRRAANEQTPGASEQSQNQLGAFDAFADDAPSPLRRSAESGHEVDPADIMTSFYGVDGPSDLSFMRSGLLHAPDPRPGFIQRFIRFQTPDGKTDRKSIMKAIHKGWRPRQDIPKSFSLGIRDNFPQFGESFPEAYVVDGLGLCEMPSVRANQLKRELSKRNGLGMQKAEESFHENAKAAKTAAFFETDTQVERGRRPRIAED